MWLVDIHVSSIALPLRELWPPEAGPTYMIYRSRRTAVFAIYTDSQEKKSARLNCRQKKATLQTFLVSFFL